jgi:hypothetical protein
VKPEDGIVGWHVLLLPLLVAGLGLPFGLTALIFTHQPVTHAFTTTTAAPSAPALTTVHDPLPSPTHWNQIIVTRLRDDGGAYAANFAIAHDPEVEDELARRYRRYPVGAVVDKAHYADLARARTGAPPDFSTRMVRTASPHGIAADPWRYERIAADGRIELAGMADDAPVRQQCADCHANAANRDFIFHAHLGKQ